MSNVSVVRFTVGGVSTKPFHRSGSQWVVVYDGHCRVCTRAVALLRRWDRDERLQIVPSQAPGLHEAFPFIAAREYLESLQLINQQNQRWQGAAAIEQLLHILPKGILIRWLFAIPFARPIADRFYRWFARNRYKLGCGEHCTYREEAAALSAGNAKR